MKYRAKFIKGDNVKFVGHLDLMRAIQRTLNRAQLHIKYSEGFNPHQILSIAQPLAVGEISQGEYMDFELTEDIVADEVKEKFNIVAPEGIMLLEVRKLDDTDKKVAALVEYGEYKVILDKQITEQKLNEFMAQDVIEVLKETKSGKKNIDIRNDIISMRVEDNILYATISTGSMQNLKIGLLVENLYKFVGLDFDENAIDAERLELYYMKEGKLKKLI